MRDSGRSVFSDSELERQESSFSICCIDRLNLRPIAVGANSTLTHLAVHVCVPLCSYASAFFMLRIWRVRYARPCSQCAHHSPVPTGQQPRSAVTAFVRKRKARPAKDTSELQDHISISSSGCA